MTKITLLSVRFTCCVVPGLLLAYAGGLDVLPPGKAALSTSLFGLAALLIVGARRQFNIDKKGG